MSNLGLKFKNKALYKQALTHSSKSPENYERLEFLGDGILDFVVGEYLFMNGDNLDEGKLTVLRAHFVAEANLCKIFDSLEIEKDVSLGKSYQGKISKAIKCDIFEALVAAIYLEKGLEETKKFIIEKLELASFGGIEDDNYKSQLQELIQSGFKCKMQYKTESENDGFVSKFFMDEDEIALGKGKSKIDAEQLAAKNAIDKLFVKNSK